MRILNEIEYAKELEDKGFIQRKYGFELKILAKYYCSIGIKDDELKKKLIEFCKLHIPKYNEIKYIKMVKNACRYGEDYSLFVVKPVRITLAEIEKIQKLNDLKVEKVAFVLLVLANINKQSYSQYIKDKIKKIIKLNSSRKKPIEWDKLKKNFPNVHKGYYVNNGINEIFKLAKVYLNKKEKNAVIKKLIDKEFISMTYSCKYKLDYIFHQEEENAVIINNFDDFVLEYDYLIGDNIGHCECCGKPFRIMSNKHKYCKECAREINIQKTIENRKNRKLFEIENPPNTHD